MKVISKKISEEIRLQIQEPIQSLLYTNVSIAVRENLCNKIKVKLNDEIADQLLRK